MKPSLQAPGSSPPTAPSDALLLASVLDALPAHVALLDPQGRIVRVNQAWRRFAQANGAAPAYIDPVGVDYLAVVDAAMNDDARGAGRAAAGLRAVLGGQQASVRFDYPCHSDEERRWFRMHARPVQAGSWHGVLVSHEDITTQVEQQRRVDAGFDAYRLLFDANPHSMWVHDSETLRFLDVNDVALAKYGYTRDEFLQLTLPDLVAADERAAAAPAGRAGDCGQPGADDRLWHHCNRDGRLFRMHLTSHALVWLGRPARLVLAEDVGDRLDAENALRESEQRLRQMADSLSEVFWLSDIATGELLYVSPAYERIWGRSAASLAADPANWLASVHPADRERVAAAFADLQTRVDDVEFSIVRPDGGMRRVVARMVPVRDEHGVVRRVAGTTLDITLKYEQRQRLRLLELAVARLNDVVLITDAESIDGDGPQIVFVNDAFERHTGYTRADVVGRTPRLLQGPATERRELDRIRAALESQQAVRAELVNYRKSGEPFWMELDIVPLTDRQDRVTHWVAVAREVTERKAFEQKLQQSQRLESLGQLTGGVAHDFNNLLTVMLGNAEVLAERLAVGTLEQRLADMIAGAAQRGADLTQRLLAFARKQPLQPRTLDVNRLLADIDALLRRSLGEHIEIETRRSEGLWHTLVDPGQLENVVLNLGINARDAMPRGGRLTLETANTRLDEEYVRPYDGLRSGEYVMLAVADTGCGIAPEHLGRVFEPFFTTKEKGKGTGLGLAMVYGFVKQSGGHVAICSAPGRGTTVRIYLPRQWPSAQDQRDEPAAAASPMGQGQLILLVEDDAMVREYAGGQLRQMGYRVQEAADGHQALALLARHADIDLLFTDVVMPGAMSGRELADRARQLHPGLPVLYTSGYSEDAIVHHGRLDPGVLLLGKPYRRADLARMIMLALSKASRRA